MRRQLLCTLGGLVILCGSSTAAPLKITTTTLPDGSVGISYSESLTAHGGNPPLQWSLTSGALPGGLVLDSGGTIAGTPRSTGTSRFTVLVADQKGATDTQPLALAVKPPPLAVATASLPNGTVGVAYSQTLTASGGSGGYSWSVTAGALPAGLSLSASGSITGTPTAAGAANFTATVTDSSNQTASKPLSINVATAPLTVTTASLPNGTVGASYSQALAASGGSGVYSWSVTAGALPAGLSLSASGAISGTPTAAATANFTATVTDSDNKKASKALSITVTDPPLTVTTASLPNGTVGTPYSQSLAATGGAGGYSWSITGGALPAGLTLAASGAISGTPTTAGTANFTATVKDSANQSASKSLSITIAAPPLTVTTASLPGGTVGTAYSQTLAATGGAGGYTWSVTSGALPAGVNLSASGTISGTPLLPGTANFTATVTDSAKQTASKPLSITIGLPLLTVTTLSLPDGTVGSPYSQTLSAVGGSGNYTWAVTSGALPAGLNLSASGTISGTPTTAGTANFTVTATDSSSQTASKPLSIKVAPAALTVTTSSLPNGSVGAAYSQTLAASGGSGGYTWAVTGGALPAGLSLSASGAISGTPTTAATANFTATVTDSSSQTASKSLSITIAAAPVTVTTTSLPNGTVGAAYSQTLTASGGTGGYSWTVTSGALPAGLNLSASGAISGTPATAGPANFTVTVTDSSSHSASQALTITIAAPGLTITTSSLPDGTVGTAYSQTLASTGGSGGNSWAVTSGALPAGLNLGTSGSITGTPTTAGTANFTVTVTDGGSHTASQALSLKIAPAALTVTTTSLPNGTVGTAYSQALAASGGSGGYAWAVSGGALPAGLSLSPSGTIAGTPTAAATANFTVQVRDSAGVSATKALTLGISPAAVVITTQSLPAAEQGVAYSQTLAATGGTGTYQWSVGGGALPTGLTMDASGRISGTPTGTSSSFAAQVTDSAGAVAAKTFTIAVTSAPTFTSQTTLASGVIGTAYDIALGISGGQSPYTVSLASGQLPPGLTLNAGSGHITGTPGQVGNFSFGLRVRDAAGAQAQANFTIPIVNGLTITTPPVLPGASLTVAYQAALLAAGGTAPYTFTASSGSLPAGLTFHPDGRIDGTPTAAGSFQFTATVTDANGSHAGKDFTLTVAAALTITTAPQLAPAVLAASYGATLAANGGTPPYTWSVTAGALPPGIILAAGTLTGSPTSAGTFAFTVTLSDSASVSVSKAFTLTVAPGVTFTTPATLPDAMAGTPYSFTLAAAGGNAPYSWRISDGALPDGLTLNGASGVISGTPSAAGTFNFTVEVTDASNLKASRVHTIVANLPSVPSLALTGVPSTLAALQQPALDLALAAPYPVAITGRLNLAFLPAQGMPDDPAVQFSTGGRSAAFTIPANAVHATFDSPLALQSGSVAGTIQLTVDSLTAGSTSLPAPGAPVLTAQVASGAPAIRTVTVTRGSGGFSVQIVGLSTTRELASATVRFVPGAGSNLQTSEVTIPLTDAASGWFQSPGSTAYGGQFTLTLPFSMQGGTAALDSVAVVLTNRVGASQESSAPY